MGLFLLKNSDIQVACAKSHTPLADRMNRPFFVRQQHGPRGFEKLSRHRPGANCAAGCGVIASPPNKICRKSRRGNK